MSVGPGRVGGRGVSVIVARVLQLPAFDYNAPHVGVLGVCVCARCPGYPRFTRRTQCPRHPLDSRSVHAGIVCTDNTLSALVYPAR